MGLPHSYRSDKQQSATFITRDRKVLLDEFTGPIECQILRRLVLNVIEVVYRAVFIARRNVRYLKQSVPVIPRLAIASPRSGGSNDHPGAETDGTRIIAGPRRRTGQFIST